MTRTLGETMMDIGLAFFVFNIVMSFLIPKRADEGATGADPEVAPPVETRKLETAEASA